eukprot:jgi/Astpho2/8874/fgenesh1_pg.00129_%23_51_t
MTEAALFGKTIMLELTAHEQHFHTVPADRWQELFSKFKMGKESALAHVLEVDGDTTMLARDVLQLVREALGRELMAAEVHAVHTCFDTDTTAAVPQAVFEKNLQTLQDLSANPKSPVTYSSYERLATDKIKHTRGQYEAPSAYNMPVTTQQDVGWHCLKALANGSDAYFPCHKTDVTIKEGRSIWDFAPMA